MDTWPKEVQRITRIAAGVQRLSAVFTRLNDKVLQDNCGFKNSQFKILWVLYRNEQGIPQNMFGGWLNQTEAAVSRQVGLMKREKLIELRKDSEDRRTSYIVLTDGGREFTETATRALIEAYAPDIAVLNSEEQEAFAVTLEKLFYRMCDKKQM